VPLALFEGALASDGGAVRVRAGARAAPLSPEPERVPAPADDDPPLDDEPPPRVTAVPPPPPLLERRSRRRLLAALAGRVRHAAAVARAMLRRGLADRTIS